MLKTLETFSALLKEPFRGIVKTLEIIACIQLVNPYIEDATTLKNHINRTLWIQKARNKYSQVILEMDCARIVSSLTSGLVDRSEIGPIIEEARGLASLLND